MRGIPVSEKYRGIKSDGIIYRGLAKYRGIPSGGTDVQYAFIMVQITSSQPHKFLSFYLNHCMQMRSAAGHQHTLQELIRR